MEVCRLLNGACVFLLALLLTNPTALAEATFACDMRVNDIDKVPAKFEVVIEEAPIQSSSILLTRQLSQLLGPAFNARLSSGQPFAIVDFNGQGPARALPLGRAFTEQVFDPDRAWTPALSGSSALPGGCLVDRNEIRLGVRFLNGSAEQRQLVILHATAWNAVTPRVQLDFVDDRSCNLGVIRVRFDEAINDSVIGIGLRRLPQGVPTMRLSGIAATADPDVVRQTIQHEFGHALGLLHEHQHASHPRFTWTQAFYDHYRARGWRDSDIAAQITEPLTVAYNCGDYDPRSVMHYPIQSGWTAEGVVVAPGPISRADAECLRRQYPS